MHANFFERLADHIYFLFVKDEPQKMEWICYQNLFLNEFDHKLFEFCIDRGIVEEKSTIE